MMWGWQIDATGMSPRKDNATSDRKDYCVMSGHTPKVKGGQEKCVTAQDMLDAAHRFRDAGYFMIYAVTSISEITTIARGEARL